MENFKLDLSKLTPVAEKDRVMGNWYVVADFIGDADTCSIRRYHSGNKDMVQGGRPNGHFSHWFLIPPNLPGFPAQELPDEFEVKAGEWSYLNELKDEWNALFLAMPKGKNLLKLRRIKPTLPELTIPEQTASERMAWLQEELDKLGK